ncbi:MAG: ribonuclease III [Deltaproteobacteria bacterium]|nr:ribonuclease III [Deltaproteobacteria bacterium]
MSAPGDDYQLFEARLGYRFRDRRLLEMALTHKSYLNENPSPAREDNERLEFLGDAVLNLTVGHLLMEGQPLRAEGELSRSRALVVNEAGLARVAEALALGDWLFLGKGEEQTGGRRKPSLLADACEAVMAAVYLDGGYDVVLRVVRQLFEPRLREARDPANADFKTRLQERAQGRLRCSPRYSVVSENGPDHDKVFEVALSLDGREVARGRGRSKKEAEQRAAAQALQVLDDEDSRPPGDGGAE